MDFELYMYIVHVYAELMASERHVKREIARLEEELPRWKTIIDTGAIPGGSCDAHTAYAHTAVAVDVRPSCI